MHGAPLTAALIRKGNIPADERRKNEATRIRIGLAFYDVAHAVNWSTPDTHSVHVRHLRAV